MRREAWLILGMGAVVIVITASLLYTIYLFSQTQHDQDDADRTAEFEGTLPVEATADPGGEQLYARSCVACHRESGRGRAGAFPPLAGHLPSLYAREGGTDYLIDVVLYGLSGDIEVDGETYRGFMAPMAHLDDGDVAEVLNYSLQAWGNAYQLPEDFTAIEAEDVADRRDQGLAPGDVRDKRKELFEAP